MQSEEDNYIDIITRDVSTGIIRTQKIGENHLLYPVAKLMRNLQKWSDVRNLLSDNKYSQLPENLLSSSQKDFLSDQMQNRDLFYLALTSMEEDLVKELIQLPQNFLSSPVKYNLSNQEQISDFIYLLEWISEAAVQLFIRENINHPHSAEIFESLYSINKLCKNKIIFAGKGKQKINTAIDTLISDILGTVAIIHFKNKDFHRAESWNEKFLSWTNKIKNKNPQDISKRKFCSKLLLARIYFEWGHSQLMLQLLEEANAHVKNYYFPGFNDFLADFLRFCKVACGNTYTNKQFYLTIKIAREFFNISDTLQEKPIFKETFQNLTLWNGHKKYIAYSFGLAIKSSKDALSEIYNHYSFIDHFFTLSFNTEQGLMQIFAHHGSDRHFLQKKLRAHDIKFTTTGNQIALNIENISEERFKSLCEKFSDYLKNTTSAIALEQEENDKKSLKEAAQQGLFSSKPAVASPQNATYSEPTSTSSNAPLASSISSNTCSTSFTEPDNAPEKSPKRKHLPSSTAFESPSSKKNWATKTTPLLTISWTKTHLIYDSSDKNKGAVKMMSSKSIPDNVWFGYIPDWIKEDARFNDKFLTKLEDGILDYGHIRDITKELKINDAAALKYENRYKFKIIIQGQNGVGDLRLYGWIEEEILEANRQKHFLICFGYIDDHNIKSLPDPKNIKENALKSASTSSATVTLSQHNKM